MSCLYACISLYQDDQSHARLDILFLLLFPLFFIVFNCIYWLRSVGLGVKMIIVSLLKLIIVPYGDINIPQLE